MAQPDYLADDPGPEAAGVEQHTAAGAGDVGRFLADLRRLRAEAGGPSYAVLARRTGLPRSTIYDGLHRKRLPNLDLTLALVGALDADQAQWQQRWVVLRSRLDAPAATPPTTPAAPWYGRRTWWLVAAAAVLAAVVAGGVTAVVGRDSGSGCQAQTVYRLSESGNLLDAAGQVVAATTSGDLFVVAKHSTGPYRHRLLGTIESTGARGYVDEAKLDRLRESCS